MAMSKAQKIIEYFSKSTQQTAKLLEFQRLGTIPLYSAPGYRPKKLLQDCQTRWWSTYRMLKRLRLCQPALICLHAAKQIQCQLLTDDQWMTLQQVEFVLKKMALWQRILEGDKYPTASLVVSAIYTIRQHYSEVIASPHAVAPVKHLVTILLADFDSRYHPPAGHEGKVNFSRNFTPQLGKGNRYTSIHPFFFIAAFLDLRTRKALGKMMLQDQYNELREVILDLMVKAAMERNESLQNQQNHPNNNNHADDAQCHVTAKSDLDFPVDGLFDVVDDDDTELLPTMSENENVRIDCEAKLASYELIPQWKMKNESGKFNDPLEFWKVNEKIFPELSALASEFLSIPATSAPLEQIWLRASRVITAKRARIKPEITSRIIICQENSNLIREHWDTLMNVPLPDNYLPPPVEDVDEDGNAIDIGQDDGDF